MIPTPRSRAAATSRSGYRTARFVELEGTDHVPWIDADQVLDPIEAFLDEVTAAEPPAAGDTERAMAATLFTDIVGSTDMNAALGDARWSALLDRHDRIVRDAGRAVAGPLGQVHR